MSAARIPCVFFFEGDVDLEMFGDMSARMKTSFETKRIPLPFCLKHISFSPSNASDIPEYVYIYMYICELCIFAFTNWKRWKWQYFTHFTTQSNIGDMAMMAMWVYSDGVIHGHWSESSFLQHCSPQKQEGQGSPRVASCTDNSMKTTFICRALEGYRTHFRD